MDITAHVASSTCDGFGISVAYMLTIQGRSIFGGASAGGYFKGSATGELYSFLQLFRTLKDFTGIANITIFTRSARCYDYVTGVNPKSAEGRKLLPLIGYVRYLMQNSGVDVEVRIENNDAMKALEKHRQGVVAKAKRDSWNIVDVSPTVNSILNEVAKDTKVVHS